MLDNQTQTPVAPEETKEVQPEAQPEAGVADTKVEAPQGTDAGQQTQEDAEAEAKLFETLAQQKGWKDPNDAARDYRELESEFTRRNQSSKQTQEELEAMELILNGLVSGDLTREDLAKATGEEPADNSGYFPAEAPKEDTELRGQVREMKARLDLQSVANKYDDFVELQPLMSEIIKEVPDPRIFEGAKGLELLRKLAKAEYMDSEVTRAKDEGKRSLTVKEVEKTRASVADGNKAKQPGEKVYTRAEVDNMPIEEYLSKKDVIADQQRRGLLRN